MHCPKTYVLYFQQLLPLSECDAKDGRLVGHLLMDLVESKPDDLAHAIRAFANCMAMLRDCGFPMGECLVALIIASAHSPSDSFAAESESRSVILSPTSVTTEQAAAIGIMVARRLRSTRMPATALRKVVNTSAVLQTLKASYVWFVPMLEVLTVHEAKQAPRPILGTRLSSIVAAEAPNSNVEADEANEESSFSSVVWLNAHTPAASTALFPLFRIARAQQCHTRHGRTGAGACGCPCERGRRRTAQ